MKVQIVKGKDEEELSSLVNRLLESHPDAILGSPYINPQTREHYWPVTIRNGISHLHPKLPSVEEQRGIERDNLLYLQQREKYSLRKAAETLGLKLEEAEELLGIQTRGNSKKLYKN